MILAPTLTLNSVFARGYSYDADALAYIQRVETADGATLESGVRLAIDNFVRGCKTDGIWDAIKSSAILAGARTLSGALQPLVGAAPTNFNFVSGDYNRKTGLVGDGITKYLDSNRNNNADPQNDFHMGAYMSELPSDASRRTLIGCGVGDAGSSQLNTSGAAEGRNRTSTATIFGNALIVSFVGISRNSSASYVGRSSGDTSTITEASQAPLSQNISVFRRSAASPAQSNARIAFYSIGESLDLAMLDTRVTSLINAYAAAIP